LTLAWGKIRISYVIIFSFENFLLFPLTKSIRKIGIGWVLFFPGIELLRLCQQQSNRPLHARLRSFPFDFLFFQENNFKRSGKIETHPTQK
jgi:hypothetical protein